MTEKPITSQVRSLDLDPSRPALSIDVLIKMYPDDPGVRLLWSRKQALSNLCGSK